MAENNSPFSHKKHFLFYRTLLLIRFQLQVDMFNNEDKLQSFGYEIEHDSKSHQIRKINVLYLLFFLIIKSSES